MTLARSVIKLQLLTAEHFLGYFGYLSILSLVCIFRGSQDGHHIGILPRILWSLTSRGVFVAMIEVPQAFFAFTKNFYNKVKEIKRLYM